MSIEASWVIPNIPKPKAGWLVFSRDYVLAALQGCAAKPSRVKRSASWIAVGESVRAMMAVLQATIWVITRIPIVSSLFETVARGYSRDALGFFMRACYWKARLKYLGVDTIIDQGVDIWGPANVSIGSKCHLGTHVRLAAGESKHGQYGDISVGDYVHLGPNVHIAGRGGVTIGDLVGVSAAAHIYSATNLILDMAAPDQLVSMSHMAPVVHQAILEKRVVIESYALIGMMARILPGVTVGKGAVVHANTELTSNVPAFANFGGQPKSKQIGWRKPIRRRPTAPSESPISTSKPGGWQDV
ncbi:MAG: acyltransferase [Phycisphaerales bacterium]|nr:acyltransferase [Phycisphaerales bacterium]